MMFVIRLWVLVRLNCDYDYRQKHTQHQIKFVSTANFIQFCSFLPLSKLQPRSILSRIVKPSISKACSANF